MVVSSLPQTSDIGLMLLNVFFSFWKNWMWKGKSAQRWALSQTRVSVLYLGSCLIKDIQFTNFYGILVFKWFSIHAQSITKTKNPEHLFSSIFVLHIQIHSLQMAWLKKYKMNDRMKKKSINNTVVFHYLYKCELFEARFSHHHSLSVKNSLPLAIKKIFHRLKLMTLKKRNE